MEDYVNKNLKVCESLKELLAKDTFERTFRKTQE